MFSAFLVVLATGAGLVSGLTLPTISAECQATYKALLTSPDAECLNLSALTKLALPGSVVPPLDQWLSGLCNVGTCSNDALNSIIQNATTGCAAEIAAVGVTTDTLSLIKDIAIHVYPTARKVFCLMDDSTNNLCATEMLSSIQDITGVLSIQNASLGFVYDSVDKVMASGLSNLTCTDCVKRGFNIVQQDLPEYSSYAVGPLQNICNASFTDGKDPAGISETASLGTFAASDTKTGNSASTTASQWTMAIMFATFLPVFV